MGSPPLTRERRFLLIVSFRKDEDHPRLRGNDNSCCEGEFIARGSPPLTRERRHNIIIRSYDSGITPAYAGTTKTLGLIMSSIGDHPRLRGNDI